jgi:hypothetical protein
MRPLVTLLLTLALAGCASPSPTPSATIPTRALPVPSLAIACVTDAGGLPGHPIPDECPSAIVAFEAAVAPLGVVTRIHIDPGPFECGDMWPGVGSVGVCPGLLLFPGRNMHGWASFAATDKVAAIALDRTPIGQNPATVTGFGPWVARVAAFEVPPAGWVMP